jgi:hypothetical protein
MLRIIYIVEKRGKRGKSPKIWSTATSRTLAGLRGLFCQILKNWLVDERTKLPLRFS